MNMEDTPEPGTENVAGASQPYEPAEKNLSEAALTTSPTSSNDTEEGNVTTHGDDTATVTDVTPKTVIKTPHIVTPHAMTPELCNWQSVNNESYEKILLHAVMHDRKLREAVMRLKYSSKDFCSAEHTLLMGAFQQAAMLDETCGVEIPVPANSAFLAPHVMAAAYDQELGNAEIQATMMLIANLEEQDLSALHGVVLPLLEAWFGAMRGKRAAREIQMKPMPDVRTIIANLQADIDAASGLSVALENRKFDYNQPPVPPEPILTLVGQTIGTPGNLVTIQGPPKSAKTAVVEAIMAAAMKDPESKCDTLVFAVADQNGRAVLENDTEQSASDHDRLLRRSYKRAKRNEEAGWLHSYLLTGMDPAACWNMLTLAVKSAVKNHGGIMMILIDGIADFCKDPNDAGECFELVRKLHKLAVDHECVIVTVIHENPGAGGGKTRGHLGSQLERKAETSLRLQKDTKTGVVEMWVERGRSCFIPKSAGVRFQWCSDAKMHLTLHASDDAACSPTKKSDKANRYAKEVEKVFFDAEVLTWTELVAKIVTVTPLAKPTAVSRIPEYVDLNLIKKNEDGTYQIVRPQSAE
jgi:hypothetical protein